MPTTIIDRGISSGAMHLFCVIKDFARGKNWPQCWPRIWRLQEAIGKSRRMVLYYLRELQNARAVEVVREPGKGSVYRVLLGLNDKIEDRKAIAPVQPIAPVPVQPIAPVPVQPIAPVDDLNIRYEASNTASSAGTEVPAAAAEKNFLWEAMQNTRQNVVDGLVKLGMPLTTETTSLVSENIDLAAKVLRHCKTRFSGKGKPILSPGGYIIACLRNPYKFGFHESEGKLHSPDEASYISDDARSQAKAARKAANEKDRARRQADAEKAYADMRDVWSSLPEREKDEIRAIVAARSPLFHQSGADTQEFDFQCMREATTMARTARRRKAKSER